MFTWPEPTARRGCCEVISCLHEYIKAKVGPGIKHLDLFSDRCRGQNLNHAMIRFLFTLVYKGNFETITYHIPVRGHSFLPCDREFGVIEKMKRKKTSVQMYTGWQDMIASKFETVPVTSEMIKNYKQHFEGVFKNSVTVRGHKFKVSTYKRFQFSSQHKLQVHASESMTGVVGEHFALLKPNCTPKFEVAALYRGMVSIKKQKLEDVKSLYKYLEQPTIDYIESIPSCEDASSDVDDFGYE